MTKAPKPLGSALDFYERIRTRVEKIGGIDLDLPPREPVRDPPNFDTADDNQVPDWLQNAWSSARLRGLDAMALDEINAEINAVRAEASGRSFATVELSEEKAKAITSSRMDGQHKRLDSLPDE